MVRLCNNHGMMNRLSSLCCTGCYYCRLELSTEITQIETFLQVGFSVYSLVKTSVLGLVSLLEDTSHVLMCLCSCLIEISVCSSFLILNFLVILHQPQFPLPSPNSPHLSPNSSPLHSSGKKIWSASLICMLSLHRGPANFCVVPVLVYILWK